MVKMFKLNKGGLKMNEIDLKELWDFANEEEEEIKFIKDEWIEERNELYFEEESELNFN